MNNNNIKVVQRPLVTARRLALENKSKRGQNSLLSWKKYKTKNKTITQNSTSKVSVILRNYYRSGKISLMFLVKDFTSEEGEKRIHEANNEGRNDKA